MGYLICTVVIPSFSESRLLFNPLLLHSRNWRVWQRSSGSLLRRFGTNATALFLRSFFSCWLVDCLIVYPLGGRQHGRCLFLQRGALWTSACFLLILSIIEDGRKIDFGRCQFVAT